jgi:hypothetical protein
MGSIPTGSAQILVDESGRRRRVARWSGRAVSVALLLWLGLLALGALGLQPLGQFPVVGQGQPRSSPPALPGRIGAAAARGAGHREAARPTAAGVPRATPGRLDRSRGRERARRLTREGSSGPAGSSKLSPSRVGTSGAPFQGPAAAAPSSANAGTGPSAATATATTSASRPGRTGVAPGGGAGAEHGASTSSPGLTDSSPGQLKPDGAPASPPAAVDPGQSAERAPQGRDQSLTIPTP